MKIVSKQRNK